MTRFTTKYVDLNLVTGTFVYVGKSGQKKTQISVKVSTVRFNNYKQVESVTVEHSGPDPDCPKDFPYSMTISINNNEKPSPREQARRGRRVYLFAIKTQTERDQWVSCLRGLMVYREVPEV